MNGAIVALVGLSHPHTQMYLETLEVLEEVSGIVLVDSDGAAPLETLKVLARYSDLECVLRRSDVSHVLVALPNDHTPEALLRAIGAGRAVFTEKPGARSADEFRRVLAARERQPVPFCIAYLNRWSPPIRQAPTSFVPERSAGSRRSSSAW